MFWGKNITEVFRECAIYDYALEESKCFSKVNGPLDAKDMYIEIKEKEGNSKNREKMKIKVTDH